MFGSVPDTCWLEGIPSAAYVEGRKLIWLGYQTSMPEILLSVKELAPLGRETL